MIPCLNFLVSSCTRTSDPEMVEVIIELSIALDVLKNEVPYKYTVFSPRSAVANDPFEFIHSAPSHFRPGYANRTLKIPRYQRAPEGMIPMLVPIVAPF